MPKTRHTPTGKPQGRQNAGNGLLPQPQSDFDGVAIMLIPQDEDANHISQWSAIDQEHLHCTITYYGDAAELEKNGHTQEVIVNALRMTAHRMTPVAGTINGTVRFAAPEGKNDPVVVLVGGEEVRDVRQQIEQALGAIGLHEDSKHAFTPHITLGYLSQHKPYMQKHVESRDIFFDRLRVGFGGDYYDFDLTGESKSFMQTKVRHVRDTAYWGLPYGTPIVAGVRPRGGVDDDMDEEIAMLRRRNEARQRRDERAANAAARARIAKQRAAYKTASKKKVAKAKKKYPSRATPKRPTSSGFKKRMPKKTLRQVKTARVAKKKAATRTRPSYRLPPIITEAEQTRTQELRDEWMATYSDREWMKGLSNDDLKLIDEHSFSWHVAETAKDILEDRLHDPWKPYSDEEKDSLQGQYGEDFRPPRLPGNAHMDDVPPKFTPKVREALARIDDWQEKVETAPEYLEELMREHFDGFEGRWDASNGLDQYQAWAAMMRTLEKAKNDGEFTWAQLIAATHVENHYMSLMRRNAQNGIVEGLREGKFGYSINKHQWDTDVKGTKYPDADLLGNFVSQAFEVQVGDYHTEVNNVDLEYGDFSISGIVLDKRGSQVGDYTRDIRFDSNSIYHSEFQMNYEHQGQGVSDALYDATIETARSLGFAKIGINANIDVGGYAWARRGFQWKHGEGTHMHWQLSRLWAELKDDNPNWPADFIAKGDKMIEGLRTTGKNHPSPEDIATLGLGTALMAPKPVRRRDTATGRVKEVMIPMHPGKALLLGSDWNGELPLNENTKLFTKDTSIDDFAAAVNRLRADADKFFVPGGYIDNAEKSDYNCHFLDLMADGIVMEMKDIESLMDFKTRHVRDTAYWGLPYGTPIVAGAKPVSVDAESTDDLAERLAARRARTRAMRVVRSTAAAKRPAKKGTIRRAASELPEIDFDHRIIGPTDDHRMSTLFADMDYAKELEDLKRKKAEALAKAEREMSEEIARVMPEGYKGLIISRVTGEKGFDGEPITNKWKVSTPTGDTWYMFFQKTEKDEWWSGVQDHKPEDDPYGYGSIPMNSTDRDLLLDKIGLVSDDEYGTFAKGLDMPHFDPVDLPYEVGQPDEEEKPDVRQAANDIRRDIGNLIDSVHYDLRHRSDTMEIAQELGPPSLAQIQAQLLDWIKSVQDEAASSAVSYVPDASVALDIMLAGRWKSQFESGTSRGMYAPKTRAQAELKSVKIMGVPTAIDPSLRPIYGCIENDHNLLSNAGHYGHVIMALKGDQVKDRMTITFGDSLGLDAFPISLSETDPDRLLASFIRHELPEVVRPMIYDHYGEEYGENDMHWNGLSSYIEAQYHGQLTADDIEAIGTFGEDDTNEGKALSRLASHWGIEQYIETRSSGGF